jgi:serine/threonine protein kinase
MKGYYMSITNYDSHLQVMNIYAHIWVLFFTASQTHFALTSDTQVQSEKVQNVHIGTKKPATALSSVKEFFGSKEKTCSKSDVTAFIAANAPKIASGLDGAVYRWTRTSDQKELAVKQLHSTSSEVKEDFKREVQLMYTVKGLGISPDIFCTFVNEGSFYYMMEYIPGTGLGEAKHYFSPLKENLREKWASVALSMLTIVSQLHKKDIVHLDAHLKNWILTPQGRLYIIDFSRSRKTSLFKCPSKKCKAPETMDDPTGKNYTKKTDVWILGEILDFMYDSMVELADSMQPAATGEDKLKLKRIVEEAERNGPSSIIDKMMEEEPKDRISLSDAMKEIEAFRR